MPISAPSRICFKNLWHRFHAKEFSDQFIMRVTIEIFLFLTFWGRKRRIFFCLLSDFCRISLQLQISEIGFFLVSHTSAFHLQIFHLTLIRWCVENCATSLKWIYYFTPSFLQLDSTFLFFSWCLLWCCIQVRKWHFNFSSSFSYIFFLILQICNVLTSSWSEEIPLKEKCSSDFEWERLERSWRKSFWNCKTSLNFLFNQFPHDCWRWQFHCVSTQL